MPAAGPDPGPRAGGDPLRRDQAPLREADQDLRDGAAGPGALRALRPLHPLLQRDRRRPVHRAVRAGGAGAGGHLRGRAVRERLLRQRRPDLPGRGADLAVLPVPGPAVRPGLDRRGLQPLRRRLQPAHRRPPGHGHPPAGPRQRRGQRGLELRPGPLRLRRRPVIAAGAHPAPVRGRQAADRLLVGGPAPGRRRHPGGQGQGGGGPGRRPPHRPGRLRAAEAGPGGARHQQRRRPRLAGGRGRRGRRRRGRRARPGRRDADLPGPGGGQGGGGGRPRPARGVAHPLAPAAQGRHAPGRAGGRGRVPAGSAGRVRHRGRHPAGRPGRGPGAPGPGRRRRRPAAHRGRRATV